VGSNFPCPDLSSQSKFDTLAMNMQLAMSDANERTRAKTKEVWGQVLLQTSSIGRKVTDILSSGGEQNI